MAKWITIVNRKFDAAGFREYVKSLNLSAVAWKPQGIVLHNTSEPTIAQWERHDWQVNLANLASYYRDDQKWHAGPHLFVSPEGICCFTPLACPGVHSPSFNNTHWGVEMVGEYVKETKGTEFAAGSRDDFFHGKGLLVHNLAVSALATLCEVGHLDSAAIKLHKEDPKTTHDCPGNQVVKAPVILEVHNELVRRKPVEV